MLSFFIFIFQINSFCAADENILSYEQKIKASIEEKYQLQNEKTALVKQINELSTKVVELKRLLRVHLKSAEGVKKQNFFEFFLKSDINKTNVKLKFLKNLNDYHLTMYKNYKAHLALLADSQKNLNETDLLINSQILHSQTQIHELEKREQVQIEILLKTNSKSFLLKKGLLTRPLDSQPKLHYGQIEDQSDWHSPLSFGETYQLVKPQKIKSVGPGIVIFRDALERWRETLIVQHNDQYYSVYAGVEETKVSVGDVVSGEQVLGTNSNSIFYFELRHNKIPINPRKWFKEIK